MKIYNKRVAEKSSKNSKLTKRRKTHKNKKLESDIQKEVVQYWRSHWAKKRNCFLIPGLNTNSENFLGRIKSMGYQKGTPDLTFLSLKVKNDGTVSPGLCIEMKSSTGSASTEQKKVLDKMKNMGYFTAVCRSKSDAIKEINAFMKLKNYKS